MGNCQSMKYENAEPVYWHTDHELLDFDKPYACTSMICNQSFWDMPFFQYWAKLVYPNLKDILIATKQFSEYALSFPIMYHRKLWEFVYICQALYERGMLRPGKRGVVFGVGTECLPDLFASFGCEILATDLDSEDERAKDWGAAGQNAMGNLKKLNHYGFCSKQEFQERVSWRNVDMNNIPDDIKGFDFCWSACALEHLGSLGRGMGFIRKSLDTVHSGGVVVHTTEYNLSSNAETMETDILSLYRKQDIEKMIIDIESRGHHVYPMDWHIGNGILDKFVDLPPYSQKDMHLRLNLEGYISTSVGLIIKKDKKYYSH